MLALQLAVRHQTQVFGELWESLLIACGCQLVKRHRSKHLVESSRLGHIQLYTITRFKCNFFVQIKLQHGHGLATHCTFANAKAGLGPATCMPTLAVSPKCSSHLAVRSSCKAAHSERRAVLGRHAGRLQLAKLGLPQCLRAIPSCSVSRIGQAFGRTGNRQGTELISRIAERPSTLLYLKLYR